MDLTHDRSYIIENDDLKQRQPSLHIAPIFKSKIRDSQISAVNFQGKNSNLLRNSVHETERSSKYDWVSRNSLASKLVGVSASVDLKTDRNRGQDFSKFLQYSSFDNSPRASKIGQIEGINRANRLSPVTQFTTRKKQAFTSIGSPKNILQQAPVEKDPPAKIRYKKAYTKAYINQDTDTDMSISNLEKRMVIHKFNHKKYDPNFLSEPNRAAMIAILSKDQDIVDH